MGIRGPALWAAQHVFVAFRKTCFHTVFPAEDEAGLYCDLVSSTVRPSPKAWLVPADAKAVIILTFLGIEENSASLVQRLVASSTADARATPLPPIIVVLMSVDGEALADKIAESSTKFLKLGAEYVHFQERLGEDLREEVEELVDRTMRDVQVPHVVREEDGAGASNQVDTQATESRSASKADVRIKGPQDEDAGVVFWPTVDAIFEGFPALQSDVDPAVGEGGLVGDSCLVKRIGRGSFGIVYSSRDVDGYDEAVKAVPKSRLRDVKDVICIWNEVRLLSRLNHQHVVRLKYVTHAMRHIFLVQDYAGCETWGSMIRSRRPTIQLVASMMTQLVSGVAHCHSWGVAHRDLHMDNLVWVLACDNRLWLKIVDFGSAAEIGQQCSGVVGTMPYIAPEVFTGQSYDPVPADAWCCGLILLESLYGAGKVSRLLGWKTTPRPVPRHGTQISVLFNELQRKYKTKAPESLPRVILDVFMGLLRPSISQRWTIPMVQASSWLSTETL